MNPNVAAEKSGQLYVPPGAPIVGIVLQFARSPLTFLSAMRERAPVVRLHGLRTTTYLLNDPALIDEALTGQARAFRKDYFTRRLSDLLGQGLLTSEGELWRRQRRLIQPAFHRERVDSYAKIMVEETARMLGNRRQDLQTRRTTAIRRDFHHEMMALTLEIVARALFGQSMGQHSATIAWALDRVLEQQNNQFTLSGALAGTWFPSPGNIRYWRARRRLFGIVNSLVRESPAKDGLLADLLQARDDEGRPMDADQIRDEVVTLILAGHETTANALRWAAWLLADRPDLQDEIVQEANIVYDSREPTAQDQAALKWSGAVVREAMRLYPPAWIVGREALEDVVIGGVTIRKGEQVAMSQYSMHRDPRFFEAPDEFRPERWLDGLERRLPRMVYFPFGGGQRMCIGAGFAMLEATLLLSMIVSTLTLRRVHSSVQLDPSVTLRPRGGLPMDLSLRQGAFRLAEQSSLPVPS